MRKLILGGLLAALVAVPALAQHSTLGAVRARGELVCGTNLALPGFAAPDETSTYRGLDADTCRAVAAAALGDATKVRFVPLTVQGALDALAAGDMDMLARNLTQTMSRDVDLGLSPAGVNFFDGQGFLVPKASGIAAPAQLAGRRICVSAGSVNEQALADFARREGFAYEPVPVGDFAEFRSAYAQGRCDAVSHDLSALVIIRQLGAEPPFFHEILPDLISRAPLGPLVRDGDPHWRSLVFWALNTLVEAEALGITAANAEAMRASPSLRIRRLLGAEPGLGAPLGLPDDWAFQVIRQLGNYGEVFERNLGGGSLLRLPRGMNALYDRGGLHYPIPMR